jgi:hypothetical protein
MLSVNALLIPSVVAWRSVPPSIPFVGAVSGLRATMLIYVGPAVIGICGAIVFALLTGDIVAEAVVGIAAFAGFTFVVTCRITLPLTCRVASSATAERTGRNFCRRT